MDFTLNMTYKPPSLPPASETPSKLKNPPLRYHAHLSSTNIHDSNLRKLSKSKLGFRVLRAHIPHRDASEWVWRPGLNVDTSLRISPLPPPSFPWKCSHTHAADNKKTHHIPWILKISTQHFRNVHDEPQINFLVSYWLSEGQRGG